MWFTSDNAAAAPPEVLAAIAGAEANARAYGADAATDRARDAVREAFEAPDAAVEFVATGTAANSIALACLCPPWGAVYCHRAAHIEMDECGAPEFFTGGAKLALIDGDGGKMSPGAVTAAAVPSAKDVHAVQPGAVSVTQATEAGTIYSVKEIAALAAAAKRAGLPVHMDGTRFANALAATGATPAEMSWRAGVDALCLGFTKNGALAAEAIILFDPAKAWELELRRKRGGHLFSKMRFMSAQIEAMLAGGLWLRLAAQANAMATRLAEGLRGVDGVEIAHAVDANLIFASLPRAAHERAVAKGAQYYDMSPPDGDRVAVRLVCSFQTKAEEVDALLSAFRG